MQTTLRPRETQASYAARKGHSPQLSISDDNHHVTEVLGYMYDDDSDYGSRRDSASHSQHASSRLNGTLESRSTPADDRHTHHSSSSETSSPPKRRPSNEKTSSRTRGPMSAPNGRKDSWERQHGASSPPKARSRAPSDTATTQFPLNDIDYESSPAAVAQELSNLQALRRMSMDVTATGDPDLPSLSAAGMPAAPSASDSEDDSSRLFWVPARLHPELAPKEFKSFLESKADQIKRRSGELSTFPPGEPAPSGPTSLDGGSPKGLNRKKSMLSRQIDNFNGRGADGYLDGAERLERKRSKSGRAEPHDPNLEELESLVSDVAELGRLSLERAESPGQDVILPSVPGQSLRRSTRTQYRRGSTKGQPSRSFNSRRTEKSSASDNRDPSEVPPATPVVSDTPLASDPISDHVPSRTEPVSAAARTTNFSRPGGRSPPPPTRISEGMDASDRGSITESTADRTDVSTQPASQPHVRPWQSKLSSHGRSSLQISPENQSIPHIVLETPTRSEDVQPQNRSSSPSLSHSAAIPDRIPERKSSKEDGRTTSPPPQRGPVKPSSPLNNNRPMPPGLNNSRSLEQMSSNPSPLPGNHTSTGDLSFIPTFSDDKRGDERKGKDNKKDETRKSSWGWLLGKEEGENKDKRLEAAHSKPKTKAGKSLEKHDGTRLDVLQNSIEGGKGRESLVLDRTSVKLEEERKKESARKQSSSEGKREKDGLFSSIFGGGKKHKGDRDSGGRKHHSRGLSPDPPHKVLKADVDYNWTRFSILEERAIYRMAHIKLANPRRALYSQVLLSNFMYSYLAKVQQMHPQMNLQSSAKQQRGQQQGKEQTDEHTQNQQYQQGDEQQGSLQGNSAYGPGAEHDRDSPMHDRDNGDGRRPSSRGGKHSGENGASYGGGYGGSYGGYHSSGQHEDFGSSLQGDEDDDDMW